MSVPDAVTLERAEAEAWADLFAARAVQIGDAVCTIVPEVPSLMINRVVGLGMSAAATDDDLDRIAESFGEVPHTIAIAPAARPADLSDRLRARGYEPGYAWVKFHRHAGRPAAAATELRVDLAAPAAARSFADVVVEGYGMPVAAAPFLEVLPGRPGWSCYVAWDGDTAAAAGAVYVGPAGAWMGIATTLPAHRRRGGQGAIMVARIRRSAELGATLVVTETGQNQPGRPSSSHGNIVRFGFEPAYVRANYTSPAPAAAA